MQKPVKRIAEDLILPVAVEMMQLMIGDNEIAKLKTIRLYNNTIQGRISEMPEKIFRHKYLFNTIYIYIYLYYIYLILTITHTSHYRWMNPQIVLSATILYQF